MTHVRGERPGRRRRGFTVIELVVVVTIMSVLFALSAPSFQKAVEQGKVDIATANLRAVWSAERFYWLDNRAYTADLAQLRALDLIAPELVATGGPFTYSIALTTDGFTASATRQEASRWHGAVTIDQAGQLGGSVQTDGSPDLTPGKQ